MRRGRVTSACVGLLLFSVLLVSSAATAQLYGSNVLVSKANTAAITSGAGIADNTATTGVLVSITGMTGVKSVVITTSSLSGPSQGISSFSGSGTLLYFDVSISLPAGTTAPSGASAQVCLTNPSVTSSDSLYYWSGSSWTAVQGVTVTGIEICGTIPVSALTGTNFVAAVSAAYDYTWVYVSVVVVVIVVVAIAFIMRRRRM
jgi:hypothetical protein